MDKENKRLKQFESRLRNLEGEPTPETWDRLQEMLRQKRRQQSFRVIRLTSVAAGFLLIAALGLAYLFVLSDRPGLLATNQDRPLAIEELETNGDQHLKEMAQKTRALFVSDQFVVEEGARQKLVPAAKRANRTSPDSKQTSSSSSVWTISDLSFLQGQWTGQRNGLIISDSWTKTKDNSLKNTREISRNKQTQLVEVWKVYQEGDQFVLTIRDKQTNTRIHSLEAPVEITGRNTLVFSDEKGDKRIKMLPDLRGYEMNFFPEKTRREVESNTPLLFRRKD